MRSDTRIAKKARRRSGQGGWKAFLRQHQVRLLLGLSLFLIIAAGFVLARSRPASGFRQSEIITAGQQVVRDAVREDLRTSFADPEETQVEEVAGGKYVLTGWVDLISAEGRTERQHYSCTLHRGDSGEWIADDVSVNPQ